MLGRPYLYGYPQSARFGDQRDNCSGPSRQFQICLHRKAPKCKWWGIRPQGILPLGSMGGATNSHFGFTTVITGDSCSPGGASCWQSGAGAGGRVELKVVFDMTIASAATLLLARGLLSAQLNPQCPFVLVDQDLVFAS